MFSNMIPKPSVASARKTPESLMAGMAITAPTGTTMRAASSTASSHGTPWSLTRCPNAAAPTAANPRCASDTCPDRRTSRPSERNSTTYITAIVHAASFRPTRSGTSTRNPTRRTAPPMLTRAGAV